MATKTTPLSYTKNLAKSLGYAVIDGVLQGTSLQDTVSENRDVVRDIYQNIKDFAKDPKGAIKESTIAKEYSPILHDGFKNLMEDIKTGNIYNKDRADQAMMASFGMDDDDFGDFDFGGDDFGEDFGSTEEPAVDGSSALAAKAQTIASGQNIKAMDIIGKTNAKAISQATARSAQYIVQAQQASTQLIMKQQAKIFNQVSVGLAGVNQNLGALVSLGEPLTAHMQNSMKFYTETSQKLDKVVNLLDGINKAVSPVQSSGSRKTYKGIDAFLTSSGAISLSGMKEMFGRNAGRMLDASPLGMLMGFQMGNDGKDMWRQMAANPLGTVLAFALPSLLPKAFKDSIDKLGKSLAGFNTALIKRLSKSGGNPIADLIGGLFGYDDFLNTRIDTSKYNKGKVDFDGKTRKAIIEVIPVYLSKILAALTGGFETRYNYDTGKFMNQKQINESYRQIFSTEARSAVGNMGDSMEIQKAYGRAGKNITPEKANKIQRDFEKYVANAIKTNNIIDPRKLNKLTEDDAKAYGFKNLEMMRDVLELYETCLMNGDTHLVMELERNINRARLNVSERFANADGDDLLVQLRNGSFDRGVYGGANLAMQIGSSGGKKGGKSSKKGKVTATDAQRTMQQLNAWANQAASVQNVKMSDKEFNDLLEKLPEKDRAEYRTMFGNLFKGGAKLHTDYERQQFIDDLNERSGYALFSWGGADNESGKGKATGFKGMMQKVRSVIESPLSAVTAILNKADKTLFEVLYGKVDENGHIQEDKEHNSVLGIMFQNMKELFTTFKDWMKEKILNPIKNWFDDKGGFKGILNSIFGIDVDALWGKVKAKAGEIGGNVVENFKSVGSWSLEKLKGLPDQFGSGSSISAWDYYVGAGKGKSKKKGGKKFKRLVKGAKKVARGVANNAGEMMSEAQEVAHNVITDSDSPVQQALSEVNNAVMTFLHAVVPDDKDLDKTAKKTKDVVKTSIKELVGDPSGAITGALMGGGLSILSGGIISPMLAASIGGAAGLVIKSKTVQKMLFGEEVTDADGNVTRQGGMLSEKLTKALTKEIPEAAGFGIAGGLAGLLPIVPGGPIGGMFIGSAIGFAKNSSTVQEMLFGDKELGTSGILGTHEDKEKKIQWLKKMAPKAAAGAILGAIAGAGPFGFIGNIFGGAALGFASETAVFQKALFGEEVPLIGDDGKVVKDDHRQVVTVRNGGIAGWIKNGIISPVANAIKPIASEIKYRSKNIIRGLGRIIGNVFRDHIGKPLWASLKHYLTPLWRVVSKPISWIGSVVAAPFKAVGRVGRNLKNRQISQGRAEYLSAGARLQYRKSSEYTGFLGRTRTEDNFVDFDTALANMDEGQLGELRAQISNASKEKNQKIRVANRQLQAVIDKFFQLSWKAGKIALSALKKGDRDADITTVYAAIESKGISIPESTKTEIDALYDEYLRQKADSSIKSNTFENYLKDLQEKLGLDKNIKVDEKNYQRYLDMVKAEEGFRRRGVKEAGLDQEKVHNELLKAHTQKQQAKLNDIINIMVRIANKLPGPKLELRNGTNDYERGMSDIREDARTEEREAQDYADILDSTIGSGSGLISARRWYRRFRGRGVSENVGGEQVDPLTGESLSYTRDDSGEIISDIGDVGNRKAERKRNAFFGKFDRIGDGVHAINDTLKGLGDKLFGNKEKQEPGLFEKLKNGLSNLLFGDDGFLGGLFGFFTGKTVSGLVGKLLNKFSFKAMLPTIGSLLGIAAFSAAVSGKLDGIFSKIGWSNPSTTEIATGANGEPLTKTRKATAADVKKAAEAGYTIQVGDLVYDDAQGNVIPAPTTTPDGQTIREGDFINSNTGELYRGGVNISSGGQQTMSNLAKKSIVHSAITGHGTAARLAKNVIKTVSNSKVGKAVTNFMANNFDDIALAVYTHVDDIIIKLADKFPHLIPKGLRDSSREIAANMAERVMKRSGTAAAKEGARSAGKAFIIAEIVIVAADFMSGYEDARTTLGIVDEPTIPQRLLSGLFRALKNFVPFLDLIPDSLIIDVLCDYIAPFFGIDVGELKDLRAKAKTTVEEYNQSEYAKKNGITLRSVEDYNKLVLKDLTVTERIGNSAKETFYDIRNRGRNFVDRVTEEGVWGALGHTAKGFAKDLSEGGLYGALGNMLPGIYGEIMTAKNQISKYASQGDLKGVWGVTLKDYTGGGTDSNGDGVIEAKAGIFTKIIGQTPLIISKIINTPIALFANLMGKLGIGKLLDIDGAATAGIDGIKQLGNYIAKGDLYGLLTSSVQVDDNTPMSVIMNSVYSTGKAIAFPFTELSHVGHAIKDKFDQIMAIVKPSLESIGRARSDIDALVAEGSFKKVWDYNVGQNTTEDNPIGGFVTAINVIQKLFGMPRAILHGIGNAIWEKMNISFGQIGQGFSQMWQFVEEGDVEGLSNSIQPIDEKNPVSGFVNAVYANAKGIAVPMAYAVMTGKNIKNSLSRVWESVKTGWNQMDQGAAQIDQFVQEGDVHGLINSIQPIDENNPTGGFVSGIYDVAKIINVPMAGFHSVGNKIHEYIDSKIHDTKEGIVNVYHEFEKMSTYADNGDIKSIWTGAGIEFSKASLLGPIFNLFEVIGKIYYTIIGGAKWLFGPVVDAAEKTGNKVQAAKDWVNNKKEEVTTKAKMAADTTKNFAKNAVLNAGVGDWTVGHLIYGSDYQSHTATDPRYQAGKGSFISQTSPGLAGQRFGGTTFGENGCAPSVASMITGMPVGATAGYALNGGYTNNAGTSADYFGNIFAQNGIPAEYVFTGGGSAQDYLASRISSGHPTVLLGQDYTNTSKAYSPFGPGNHYVLATGTDSRGNIIVQDPEASRPNITYDRSILNSVKLGIPTGGSSRLMRRRNKGIRRALFFRGGASLSITDNHKQIWTFLKSNGLSDAGAAGIMGCWQCESSNRPDRIEGDYVKSFPGFSSVASNSSALDNWTQRLFSMYANKGLKINQGAYKGEDGHYYPGFGLAQWTGKRGYKLLSWCREKGYDWKLLRSQLEYALHELQGSYSGVYNSLKSASDPMSACQIAYSKYEGGPSSKQNWLQERQGYAVEIYNALSGKTYSMPTDTGNAANNIYGTSSESSGAAGATGAAVGTAAASGESGGVTSKITTISSLFGKMFTAAMGGLGKLFGFGDDEEESGSYSSSGGYYDSNGNWVSGGDDSVASGIPAASSGYSSDPNIAGAQKALVDKLGTKQGKLYYSQQSRNPDKGASDCSSTVQWAYQKVLGVNSIGGNTGGMWSNGNLTTVDSALGKVGTGYVQNSPGPDYDKIQPGDVMLWSRKSGHNNYNVGHATMYIGDGKMLSHGGPSYNDMGPKIKNVSADAKHYLITRRFTPFVDGTYTDSSYRAIYGNGMSNYGDYMRNKETHSTTTNLRIGEYNSGSTKTNSYGEYMQSMHGRGSGLYNVAQAGYNTVNRQHRHARSVFGGGSGIVNLSKLSEASKARYISALQQYAGGGAMTNDAMMTLIKGIISLLSNVSANSDQIKEAVVVLNKILEVSSGNSGGDMNLNVSTAASDMNIDDTDSTIREMQQLLQNLAAGA